MPALAARLSHGALDPERVWLAFVVATYFLITQSFWPILSQRDYLAVMPLMAMFIAAFLLRYSTAAMAVLTIGFLASLIHYADGFRDRAGEHVALMREVLVLTRHGDCIMDLKGETIYRRRPFYYALETIARSAISHRTIADTIPDDVIACRCHVAVADAGLLPRRARDVLVPSRHGDCTMDRKGDTIDRRRPFYYALETIARSAISHRTIADTIPEDVIACRCHVAVADAGLFPPRARAFLAKHFVDLG